MEKTGDFINRAFETMQKEKNDSIGHLLVKMFALSIDRSDFLYLLLEQKDDFCINIKSNNILINNLLLEVGEAFNIKKNKISYYIKFGGNFGLVHSYTIDKNDYSYLRCKYETKNREYINQHSPCDDNMYSEEKCFISNIKSKYNKF